MCSLRFACSVRLQKRREAAQSRDSIRMVESSHFDDHSHKQVSSVNNICRGSTITFRYEVCNSEDPTTLRTNHEAFVSHRYSIPKESNLLSLSLALFSPFQQK